MVKTSGANICPTVRPTQTTGVPQIQDILQDFFSLLAFTQPHNSPMAHLLDQDRRQPIADFVNSVILGMSASLDHRQYLILFHLCSACCYVM